MVTASARTRLAILRVYVFAVLVDSFFDWANVATQLSATG